MVGVVSSTKPARAQDAGTIVNIFADPGDFVLELSEAGDCGSKYLHIQRANTNFKEMVALSLTAFAAGKVVTMFVASCEGIVNTQRGNIVSHGYASR